METKDITANNVLIAEFIGDNNKAGAKLTL